mmetsp:Transcript_139626/g.348196  ORF Transcript_139626/g.348196 Transcript_139626/m.348196 type:complete len:116 (+) Transcript_139626:76-423(+)
MTRPVALGFVFLFAVILFSEPGQAREVATMEECQGAGSCAVDDSDQLAALQLAKGNRSEISDGRRPRPPSGSSTKICVRSPAQLCRMICTMPRCGKNMCALRVGSCCEFTCQRGL